MAKTIKFIKPMDGGYREGDAATFEEVVAERVIAAGYGEEIALEDTKVIVEKKNAKIDDPNGGK
ncbi:hypothetical protein [Clostridium tagluense]|uniref:hypothetical protein n=1 Tax=Clostridium tagluense TaxID=360422 RepID=UPI001C6ECE05|nr:hypothetical protein [Clostridium tagluense]MBW9158879.1 hypothetical protein [Clostridium tagluense]WLC67144.1 hypothetical protein KTC93_08185 [Clostridium tagluense]